MWQAALYPARSTPGTFGRLHRQQAALDFGGLLQLLGVHALGLLHFGQARVFDADGRHVRHHGEQAQIVLGEFLDEVRRVQIDQPDDAIVGLQRDRQHAANLLLHDAHAVGERLVQAGVAHQQRRFFLDHAVAHRVADAEAFAQRRRTTSSLPSSVISTPRVAPTASTDRFMISLNSSASGMLPGQFAAGADQRAHLRAAFDFLFLAEHAFQAGGDGGGNRSGRRHAFDEDDGIVGGRRQRVLAKIERDVAGRDAIVLAERIGRSLCGRR